MNEEKIYKEFVEVLEKYRQLLIDEKKLLGFVNDIKLLPADKNTLKVYLSAALMSCKSVDEKVYYSWAYEELASFQPNIGKKPVYPYALSEILERKYYDISESKSEEKANNLKQEIHNISQKDLTLLKQYLETTMKERKKLREELAQLDI